MIPISWSSAGGDAAWLYPTVRQIAARFDAKLVYYITDDYVLPKRSANVAEQLSRAWTRIQFKRMLRSADLVLTIGEEMSAVYATRFGATSRPLMNLVEMELDDECERPEASDGTIRFVYAGSLHSGRWKVIEEVSRSIERLRKSGVQAGTRPLRAAIGGQCSLSGAPAAPVHLPGDAEFGGAED